VNSRVCKGDCRPPGQPGHAPSVGGVRIRVKPKRSPSTSGANVAALENRCENPAASSGWDFKFWLSKSLLPKLLVAAMTYCVVNPSKAKGKAASATRTDRSCFGLPIVIGHLTGKLHLLVAHGKVFLIGLGSVSQVTRLNESREMKK
jgi:hypothetical protein